MAGLSLALAAVCLLHGPVVRAAAPQPFLDIFNELGPGYVQLEGAAFVPGDSVTVYIWSGQTYLFQPFTRRADSNGHVFVDFNIPRDFCRHSINAWMSDETWHVSVSRALKIDAHC
jgi:hypothetical protein